jgi:hypothetical protein
MKQRIRDSLGNVSRRTSTMACTQRAGPAIAEGHPSNSRQYQNTGRAILAWPLVAAFALMGVSRLFKSRQATRRNHEQ